MGEIAEYDLSQISDDDHEDRIADLKRLLDECQAKRASADKRARERLKRVSELEAWVREALPYLKDTQRFLTYVPEGGLWHEFGGVITCGEKLLEGADG